MRFQPIKKTVLNTYLNGGKPVTAEAYGEGAGWSIWVDDDAVAA
jgi:hypothetical protein